MHVYVPRSLYPISKTHASASPVPHMLIVFIISGVTPMVQDAKAVAVNPQDSVAVSRWRESNRAVSLSFSLLPS
jgi:hypothetical protein